MSLKVTGIKGILLGSAVGLVLGLAATFNVPAPFQTPSNRCLGILFGGLIGAAGSCLLWWIDRKRERVSPKVWMSAMMSEEKKKRKTEESKQEHS
jgi:hypothetical protein